MIIDNITIYSTHLFHHTLQTQSLCELYSKNLRSRTPLPFNMALTYNLFQNFPSNKPSNATPKMKLFSEISQRKPPSSQIFNAEKRCLRCNTLYQDSDNSPTACSFHGHTTGEKGLFSLAPPHQGIDGEWSDRSGVIVYIWNEKKNRPNTGRPNWKKRWSCCAEYEENAPPCRRGWHVSYDDGFTLY